MKLISIEINNFMSFGSGNKLYLKDRGLVLIEGVNNASTSASSNGAGKTSIFEAIVWCIYGQTTKNVSADDVVNHRVKKDCSVELFLSLKEEVYSIRRTRSHSTFGNSLKLSVGSGDLSEVDVKSTQAKIDQFLGTTFQLFCNSVYFSQTNLQPFSEYTDKQLKEILLRALDMERFQNALQLSRIDSLDCEKKITSLIGVRDRLGSELSTCCSSHDLYLVSDGKFESNKEIELGKISEQISGFTSHLEKLEAEVDRVSVLEDDIKEYRGDIEFLLPVKDELTSYQNDVLQPFQDKLRTVEIKHSMALSSIKKASDEKLNIHKRIGSKCTECGRVISEDCFASYLESIDTRISVHEETVTSFGSLLEKASEKLKSMMDKKSDYVRRLEELDKIERKVSSLRDEVVSLRSRSKDVGEYREDISKLQSLYDVKKTETSPFKKFIDESKDEIARLEMEMKRAIVQVEVELLRLRYFSFWSDAFGYSGIPSFLLDSVTPFLNERANHYSSIVCNGEIKIEFSTTTMGKSGSKDKFAINVSHSTGGKKYRSISGGERRRADVCIAQALFDLTRSYGKNPLDIIAFDEPYDSALDQEGIEGVSSLLQEVVKDIGTVLVVSHVPELKSSCENVVRVVKSADGVSSIQ